MAKYVISLDSGYQRVIEENSLENASTRAYREEGTHHVKSVKLASADDLAWHQAMGGSID